ncbi:hypothetical protein [Kribbella sp. NPDC023855]|uniref:hypothetical protein n=1 Tax=Kribbella sp. NPDC023855 TaxID=3154698 RepID=UPI0033DAF2BD
MPRMVLWWASRASGDWKGVKRSRRLLTAGVAAALVLGVAAPVAAITGGFTNVDVPPEGVELKSGPCLHQVFGPEGRLLFTTCTAEYTGTGTGKRFSLNAIVMNNNPISLSTKYYIDRVDLVNGAGTVLDSCKGGWLGTGETLKCTVHPPAGNTYARVHWITPDGEPAKVEMTIANPV